MKKTVSTLQSQIANINGKVKTLDKDLVDIEKDFKGRFSFFNFEI
jgi:flagellar capping protein FliD